MIRCSGAEKNYSSTLVTKVDFSLCTDCDQLTCAAMILTDVMIHKSGDVL